MATSVLFMYCCIQQILCPISSRAHVKELPGLFSSGVISAVMNTFGLTFTSYRKILKVFWVVLSTSYYRRLYVFCLFCDMLSWLDTVGTWEAHALSPTSGLLSCIASLFVPNPYIVSYLFFALISLISFSYSRQIIISSIVWLVVSRCSLYAAGYENPVRAW